ncbi:RNA-guided endonuclease InsQ/TnpB family protein [Bacillus benzoevorans]|uniref:Putative transposase n=1 Tax=Bacillus benzoevorans TaxID=1456 RepID=A0A7X0LW49_9BACI|nr:RNA-guided endonuclease TnpB family protein [Bacillus benzoevorans]MBB6445167.1 putative transposase [Bacillus benzoevorans]
MENENKVGSYSTQQIWIKKGHRMYAYFQSMCENSKNLYNTTNFYIRQVYTALTSKKELHPLQKEVMDTLAAFIDPMNKVQTDAYEKRLAKEQQKPAEKRKEVTCNLFSLPDCSNPYVHYNFLDALFKLMKQNDYQSLPIQSSQSTMKTVFKNWKSFYVSLKDWKVNPAKYTGKPNIPRYSRATMKEIEFTNQDCVIKENKFLKFPKTKEKLNIGKLGSTSNKLKSVRVIPRYDQFVVELVFEKPELEEREKCVSSRFMSIDLGIDNLATITTNTGMTPVLLKGKAVKSINQYYNKMRAYYYSILRQGKDPKEGLFSSKRLIHLDAIRHRKLKDLFHKFSFFIKELAAFENIDTIIIGQNEGWKQNSNIGKVNNQKFVQIPYSLLISMIRYKAEEISIKVFVTEESYTSKASFLDGDTIPKYREKGDQTFSGHRISRGLYRTKSRTILNADVNGSANIMRKYTEKGTIPFRIEDVEVHNPLTYRIT